MQLSHGVVLFFLPFWQLFFLSAQSTRQTTTSLPDRLESTADISNGNRTASYPNYAATFNRSTSDEQQLLRQMFINYDPSVRPVINATSSVPVTFQMILIQIMDMDEKNQVLVTNAWLEHAWIDERLTWNPTDFNDVHVIRVPPKKVWVPDIVLYNNADDFTTGYMPNNVVIHHQGKMYWSPPARLRSSCKVDITFFPFDRQTCHLKFGSWTYDQAQVDILKKRNEVETTNYVTNGEWKLLSTKVVRHEKVYPIGDEVYPDVTVILVIQRLVLYYLLNILCPCVWLNILSLLSFILPPSSGEKVTLGITVLLSYSVFMLLVANNIPSTSEFVPLIGIYLTVSMAVTSISVILTVCVLKLHHDTGVETLQLRSELVTGIQTTLQPLLRSYLMPPTSVLPLRYREKLPLTSPAGMMDSVLSTEAHFAPGPRPVTIDSHFADMVTSPTSSTALHNHVSSDRYNNAASSGIHQRRAWENFHNFWNSGTASRSNLSASRSLLTNNPLQQTMSVPSVPASVQNFGRAASNPRLQDDTEQHFQGVADEILCYLRAIISKRDEDEVEETISTEWRRIARVMDRFLFYVFLACTTICTGTLVVVIPLFQYNS